MIKYGIAIEIIMDDDFKYTDNTNTDFIENISLMLFNDKSVMKKIEDDYKRIKNCVYGKNFKNFLELAAKQAANLISKIAIKDLIKSSRLVFKKTLVIDIIGRIAVSGIDTFLKLRKQANKLSTLSPGDLANKLIIIAMNLLYADKHFKSKMEYNNYFKNTLVEVNLDRRFIMKEMFEDQYEIDANKLKIELLHNFDDYLIEQMNVKLKKKGKLYV